MADASGNRLFLPWLALATACTALMWLSPGEETIPYHVAYIGLAVAYGLEPWPWLRTLMSVLLYTVVTGVILVVRAAQGLIVWGETAEIPLMAILVLVVVHNVRTAHVAQGRLADIARGERLAAERRERISRMTSHEMRTPATIAMGYVEMLLAGERDEQRRQDLEVVHDELGRLVLVGGRLIRTLQMQEGQPMREHDLHAILSEAAERWSVVADREWTVSCPTMTLECAADRLRACLDTLVENALRYTADGDTIRFLATLDRDHLLVGVADSGPGMAPELLETIAGGDFAVRDSGEFAPIDIWSQTGLGLALVQDAAEIRGGRLVAGRSAEGGALVLMAVPVVEPDGAPERDGTDRPRRRFVPPAGGFGP